MALVGLPWQRKSPRLRKEVVSPSHSLQLLWMMCIRYDCSWFSTRVALSVCRVTEE